MAKFKDKSSVEWNVHLSSSPSKVFEVISTDEGRRKWWSGKSEELNGFIDLGFGKFKVVESKPHELFRFTYFGGTEAVFTLTPTPDGGTDFNVTETKIPDEEHFMHNYAGWVEILLVLKGAVDFNVDLRNKNPGKSWEDHFVDI